MSNFALALLVNGVARGSLFAVFGREIGPASIVTAPPEVCGASLRWASILGYSCS